MIGLGGAPMLVTVTAAMALSVTFVGLVRWDANRRGLLDRPNARSSHALPTPRGGGLGLLLAILGSILGSAPGAARLGPSLLAAAGVALVAMIGWVDDHKGAPVHLRLAAHMAAGILVLPLAMAAPLPLPAPVAAVWWMFWTVSAINVINFVDGIDGIIGLQVLIYGIFVALVGSPEGGARLTALVLVGASAGFLVWNWSPARIFLGDVGSGALGVLVVALGASLVAEGRVGFVAAFAPLAPIFLDASVTLARRARRGERLSEAHRSHLYQRLANGRWGHARVAQLYGALSAGAAAVAAVLPQGGLLLLAALLTPLLVAGLLLERAAAVPADPPMLP